MARRIISTHTPNTTDTASDSFVSPENRPFVVSCYATVANTGTLTAYLQEAVQIDAATPAVAQNSADWACVVCPVLSKEIDLGTVAQPTITTNASGIAATTNKTNLLRWFMPAGPSREMRLNLDVGTANTTAVTVFVDE